jgi:hypothetical protein
VSDSCSACGERAFQARLNERRAEKRVLRQRLAVDRVDWGYATAGTKTGHVKGWIHLLRAAPIDAAGGLRTRFTRT